MTNNITLTREKLEAIPLQRATRQGFQHCAQSTCWGTKRKEGNQRVQTTNKQAKLPAFR